MRRILSGLAGGLMALALAGAPAQAYPDQPIRIVVPFPAGGAVDALARIIGAEMQDSMGQPVVVENRPGAGGNIAAAYVAKAEPDGYTLFLTTNGHAISPSLYSKLPFDPLDDFEPVTQVIASSLLLVAANSFEAKTLQQALKMARAKPGKLNYGSTGIGNPLHLTMEMLKSEAKADIQMVPFRGDAPLNQALLRGEVQMAVVPLGTARPLVEGGKMRALAVTGPERSPAMPDVPTIAEQGFPGFASASWQGLFFPAGTPREIVERVHQEVAKALKKPQVLKRLAGFGAEPVGSSPDEFEATVKADIARFARIVKEAKIPKQD